MGTLFQPLPQRLDGGLQLPHLGIGVVHRPLDFVPLFPGTVIQPFAQPLDGLLQLTQLAVGIDDGPLQALILFLDDLRQLPAQAGQGPFQLLHLPLGGDLRPLGPLRHLVFFPFQQVQVAAQGHQGVLNGFFPLGQRPFPPPLIRRRLCRVGPQMDHGGRRSPVSLLRTRTSRDRRIAREPPAHPFHVLEGIQIIQLVQHHRREIGDQTGQEQAGHLQLSGQRCRMPAGPVFPFTRPVRRFGRLGRIDHFDALATQLHLDIRQTRRNTQRQGQFSQNDRIEGGDDLLFDHLSILRGDTDGQGQPLPENDSKPEKMAFIDDFQMDDIRQRKPFPSEGILGKKDQAVIGKGEKTALFPENGQKPSNPPLFGGPDGQKNGLIDSGFDFVLHRSTFNTVESTSFIRPTGPHPARDGAPIKVRYEPAGFSVLDGPGTGSADDKDVLNKRKNGFFLIDAGPGAVSGHFFP